MICYKDMTFCSSNCINQECFRYFGEKQKQGVVKWWGSEDAPVAFADFSEDCPEYMKLLKKDLREES